MEEGVRGIGGLVGAVLVRGAVILAFLAVVASVLVEQANPNVP